MPEMPEIRAHCERMSAALAGATLSKFQLLNFAGLKTFDPPVDAAVGATVSKVSSRAKYLIISFGFDQHHAIHLMQGGRLKPDAKQARKPRNGIARWVFEIDGHEEAWLLSEAGSERKAGVWALAGNPLDSEPLSNLGPEAVELTRAELGALLESISKRLHGTLRSQRVISGLGRMLTNEILFAAEISPFALCAKLDDAQLDRLHDSIQSVVESAIEHERTLDAIGKSADRPSKVHNRDGEPCLGTGSTKPCGELIRTISYRRYTVYYCPGHQTGGKVLADNTTSKFLK